MTSSVDKDPGWLPTPTQMALVLDHLDDPFRAMTQLARLTLMRPREIPPLRQDQVDLSQGVIVLPTSKTGPATVVLSTAALRILRAQLDPDASPWVFADPRTGRPYSPDRLPAQWRRAVAKAGLPSITFHQLRRLSLSMLVAAGVSPDVLRALARLTPDYSVFKRLRPVSIQELRAAAEALSQAIAAKGPDDSEASNNVPR